VAVVERYQSAQLRYRTDLRKRFVARLLTVKADLSNAEIDRLLRSLSPDQHRNLLGDMVLKVLYLRLASLILTWRRELSPKVSPTP
jgi:hypothetical protein